MLKSLKFALKISDMQRLLVLSLLGAFFLFSAGCKNAQNGTATGEEQEGSATEVSATDVSATAALKDKRPRLWFDETYVQFYLREVENLTFVPFDSLPWGGGIKKYPQSGEIAYFFLDGEHPSLSVPHIRVEYVYRRQNWCRSMDSLFLWTKQTFMNEARQGILVNDIEEIPTYMGRNASIWTIHTPEVAAGESIKPQRWMSWAYVPQNDYYIALVLTTFDQFQQDRGLVNFRNLIRTIEEDTGQSSQEKEIAKQNVKTGTDKLRFQKAMEKSKEGDKKFKIKINEDN